MHPLVGQHGHVLDVLHQHRADGVFPGGLGRLPGRVAALVVDQRTGSAGACDRGVGVRVLWAYNTFSQVMIDVGSQQSPQLIYFGTDARIKDPTKWVVPIEVLAAYFFVLVALLFIGPGQEMGRRFAAIDNRLVAYTADILGSLAGIAVFGLMSVFRVPAWVWFLIALAIGICFVPRRRVIHAVAALAVLAVVGLADWPRDALGVPTEVIWSPYYQVRFKPRYLSIDVNNLGHQGMLPVDRAGPAYFLPHLLNRDAGGKPFEDVLIIGAGSGNDVAAALAMGAGHVDAVEIDPVINELGRLHHPNRPYSDPRVSIHLDDGRGFIRKTPSRYDLDQLRAWSIRWPCIRAIRASGSRASCSPSRRFATSRPSSSPAACSRCTTSTARAGSWAGW